MVKSLQELGIPDYSESKWLQLDDLSKWNEHLLIRSAGELSISSFVTQEDKVKYTFFLENPYVSEHLLEGRDHSDIEKAKAEINASQTYQDVFDFFVKNNDLDVFLYRCKFQKGGFFKIPYFTNNFILYFVDPDRINTVKKTYSRSLAENDYRRDSKEGLERILKGVDMLELLMKENGITPSETIFPITSWDSQKSIYPYHVLLRRLYSLRHDELNR